VARIAVFRKNRLNRLVERQLRRTSCEAVSRPPNYGNPEEASYYNP
jgi:hypothetical protein